MRRRTSNRWTVSWPRRSARRLARLGYEGSLVDALGTWAGTENYEMRLTDEGIDARVLRALREATPD